MKVTHTGPRSWWRDRREDVFAWVILVSAAFAGSLLARIAWRMLVG